MADSCITIAGSGSYLPEHTITNDDIARLIGRADRDGGWAWDKLGIRERRFLTPLDESGFPVGEADELDMAERAAAKAMASAGLAPFDVDGLWYISCTQAGHLRHHFSRSSYLLHQRLGLRHDAVAMEMDAGCGGALHAVIHGMQMLRGGSMSTMLIVASNAPSRFYGNWHAYVSSNQWLPMYVFGDGAGAILLHKKGRLHGAGIATAFAGNDPERPLIHFEPSGTSDPIYKIDGRAVAVGYGHYAKKAIAALMDAHSFNLADVDRFYFHQVNARVLAAFVEKMDIPEQKVAAHIERYGNISAAATLVLFDEDRRQGRVSDGDLCLFCAVGAGAQYGAMLVRV